MKENLVLYHANCPDGFAAAYVAWLKFGDNAEYVPAHYGQPAPIDPLDLPQHLYVLDFSYSRPILNHLAVFIPQITVLEHHKTALELLFSPSKETNCTKVSLTFDMEECGATLAWKHFFPTKHVPTLLQYIKDRDLWQWKLEKSREINAAIGSYPQTFVAWDLLRPRVHDNLYIEGEAILRYQKQSTARLCEKAYDIVVGLEVVPCVNTAVLQSEVGEALLDLYPKALFVATWMQLPKGVKQFSLRSRGDFDVSEIALKYGGGGHKNAAGFTSNKIIP